MKISDDFLLSASDEVCLNTFFFPFSCLASHLDRVRSVDGDLIIRGIAAGQAEVEVLDLQVEVR